MFIGYVPHGSMRQTSIEKAVRDFSAGSSNLQRGLHEFMGYPVDKMTVAQLRSRIQYLKDMDNAEQEITLERFLSHMLCLNLLAYSVAMIQGRGDIMRLSPAERDRLYMEHILPLQEEGRTLGQHYVAQLMPAYQFFQGWPNEPKRTDQVQGHGGDAGVGTPHAAGDGQDQGS